MMIRRFFKRYWLTLTGIIVGAAAGWFYWIFVGCDGTCAFTSSPISSTIWGTVTGWLLFSGFQKKPEKKE